jgi:hypothetical protein
MDSMVANNINQNMRILTITLKPSIQENKVLIIRINHEDDGAN